MNNELVMSRDRIEFLMNAMPWELNTQKDVDEALIVKMQCQEKLKELMAESYKYL